MEREFVFTEKMFDFLMENSKNFVLGKEIFDCNAHSHFKFLMEEMLKSEDPEIRVDFSRALMFKGFEQVLRILGQGIAEITLKGAEITLKGLVVDK